MTAAPTPDDGLRAAVRCDDPRCTIPEHRPMPGPHFPTVPVRGDLAALADEWEQREPKATMPNVRRQELRRCAAELRAALAAHPAPTPVAEQGDGLAEVIAAHPRRPSLARGVERCGCGTSAVGQPGWYAAHVADAVRAHLAGRA